MERNCKESYRHFFDKVSLIEGMKELRLYIERISEWKFIYTSRR